MCAGFMRRKWLGSRVVTIFAVPRWNEEKLGL